MAQIIWTEPALQELDEIADYISLDKPDAARRLVRKVFERVGRLRSHHLMGKLVHELETDIYRWLSVPPCKIFYRTEAGLVFIIHIIRDKQMFHPDIL